MTGFSLLLAHLVGDYLLQWDYLAATKTAPHPGPFVPPADEMARLIARKAHRDAVAQWWRGHEACTLHCLLYTLSVALFTLSAWPWWAYAAAFAAHWPIDRWRLARWWMTRVSSQRQFASGPLAPWSVVVVDNVFHLLTLWLLAHAVALWA